MTPERKSRLIGYLSLILTVAIWGTWIVFTRQTVTHLLTPVDVAFLRVIAPTIILAPVIWRTGIFARGKIVPLFFCVLGGGSIFVFLAATGTRTSNSADFAALVPGTLPLMVALLSAAIFKEKIDGLRIVGFICATVGVFAITGRGLFMSDSAANWGHALLLFSSFVYALNTVALRRSGLRPIEAAALVSFWSLLLMLPFGLPEIVSVLQVGHIREVMFQAVLQGVLTGLIALIAFNTGVEKLGPSKAAAFVALVPVVATLIAIPVLSERPDLASMIGVAMTSLGVLLASGILTPPKRPAG